MLQLHIVAGQMHHDCHFPFEAKSVWRIWGHGRLDHIPNIVVDWSR